MLLSFPYMHSVLLSDSLPDSVMVLDPGVSEEEGAFRPTNLPLEKKVAMALINDCIRFGEQFKDPSEMAYFGAITADDYYDGSSMLIQAQLTRQFDDGTGSKQERELKEATSKAQFVLLLAWFFEEKMIELASIEDGVRNSWKSMDKTLGVDEDDRINERVLDLGNRESHTGGASDEQTVPLPWKRIVEALPAFIPEDTTLLCTDSQIISDWDDMEISFTPADAAKGLPEGAEIATCPAWVFAGRRREPADLPFALKNITVGIIR